MGGLVIVIEVGADLRAALSPTHAIEVERLVPKPLT